MGEVVILRKLSTAGRQLRQQGLSWMVRAELEKAAVWALSKRFSFRASWHPPTIIRPYRKAIADAVNGLHPQVVCEVGCGLGSILARLKAPKRIGYDIEPNVLNAARLIRSPTIEFHEGTIRDLSVPSMDVLILVNWIHEIPPADLARDVLPLLARTKYLVVDAIDPEAQGYSYKHDFRFLANHVSEVATFRMPNEPRSFLIYEVK